MIGNDWDQLLNEEYKKDYFKKLISFIKEEYKTKTIFPIQTEVFKALNYTSYLDTKVVILGQDPYHEINQAEGLSFSVKDGIKLPPSLENIYKELKDDLGYDISKSGSLIPWAKQGVLLLNAVLTVREGQASSHKNKGWEIFTDEIIKKLNEKNTPIVFILWGTFAKSKEAFITNKIHYIIKSPHPSPLSAYNGFFGSKPFSKANNFLKKSGQKEIEWQIKAQNINLI